MGYRIELGEAFDDGVRRIAHEQIGKALAALGDDVVEAVHDVRKRCKKVRGLLRLARPALDGYSRGNAAFRDTARLLSAARDAHARVETMRLLPGTGGRSDHDGGDGESLASVTQALQRDSDAASEEVRRSGVLDKVHRCLEDARPLVDGWRLPHHDDEAAAVIADATAKVHKRGRRAMAAAEDAPVTEQWHEWRKRAKYLRYHARVLGPAAPGVLGPLRDQLKLLSDLLGDDHDLAVLARQVAADPGRYGAEHTARALGEQVAGRRAGLQQAALALGARVYVEECDAFGARMAGYWLARQAGPEPRGEPDAGTTLEGAAR